MDQLYLTWPRLWPKAYTRRRLANAQPISGKPAAWLRGRMARWAVSCPSSLTKGITLVTTNSSLCPGPGKEERQCGI